MWESELNTRDGWLCSFPGTTAAMCNLTRLYSLTAAMLNPSSALSWQAHLLNFSSTSSRQTCSVHLCSAPTVETTTGSDLQDKTWVPLCSGWVQALPKRLVTAVYRTQRWMYSPVYRGERTSREPPPQKLMTGGCPERWAGVGRAAEAACQPSRICFLISLL